MKRIVVISDTHCDHISGLTHPDYQITNKRSPRYSKLQKEVWNWYCNELEALGKIDICFHLGDCIDIMGNRKSPELNTGDTNLAIEQAVMCIKQVNAKKNVMVFGSGFHTGKECDYDKIVADEVGASISGQEFIEVNGNIFHLKHHTGRSSIPHGKGTLIAKEALWGQLWADIEMTPKANIYLRGHVHYPYEIYDPALGVLAITLPALQWGTRYGRQCLGIISIGFLVIDVYKKGEYKWQFHIAKLKSQKAQLLKL